MEKTEIDGVPVFWQVAPGPLRAALIFRVGRRDETFVTGGITHLVEHLAMSTIGRTHLDCNASVENGCTLFTATGDPDRVADFLGSICRALADLPVERLATEVAVLRVEEGAVAHPSVCSLLARRYGARGVGLAGFEEPALGRITADQVRRYAATHFVRGNAALTLTGPPPSSLSLPLPDGAQPTRPDIAPLTAPLPGWSEHPVEGVAVWFTGPECEALAVGLRVLRIRLEDELRHARGLVYDIDFSGGLIRPGLVDATLWCDPRPANVPAVVQGIVTTLRRLAEEGPTAADLAHDLDGFEQMLDDERAIREHLDDAALDLLAGKRPRTHEEWRAERDAVDAAEVRAALTATLPSVYVLVPEELDGAGLDETARSLGLTREPESLISPVAGRVLKRRLLSSAPRGSTLTVSDDGISLRVDDDVLTVRFNEAVGVERDPDGVHRLVGVDGRNLPLKASDWKDGDAVLDLVRRMVPAELWYDVEPD